MEPCPVCTWGEMPLRHYGKCLSGPAPTAEERMDALMEEALASCGAMGDCGGQHGWGKAYGGGTFDHYAGPVRFSVAGLERTISPGRWKTMIRKVQERDKQGQLGMDL